MRRTQSTTDLLADLRRSEPDFAPYLLMAWLPELTAQTPSSCRAWRSCSTSPWLCGNHGPDTASQRLTWRCTIRNTTGVELDDDWFELTRDVLDATGNEPDDAPAACRLAALRNQANGLDIVATVIRQDDRWARLHNDASFARSACADFAYDHGLDKPQ